MNKSVTMKNIADVIGVSTVTVSKALADKEGVGEELRQAIKEKADEMGYNYASSKQKSLKEKQKFNIGVIVASNYVDVASYSFYLSLYHNIILRLAKDGYSGIMEIITDEMRKEALLPTVVVEQKVDGIIVLGQLAGAYVEKIRQTGMPVVLLDFYDATVDTDSVVTDNVYGTYMLTDYCINRGHKKIAFVGSIHSTASILDRYLGYCRALFSNRIRLREDYLIEDRGEDLLNYEKIELPEDMPTAFVCNCDEVAYRLMEQLSQSGYRVPEDISVVGFDNYTFIDYAKPKLTTVAVNMEAMSDEAVSMLIRQIVSAEPSNLRKVISGTLIIRDSVKDIRNS